MVVDPAAVVMLVCMLVQKDSARAKEIDRAELPREAAGALAAWVFSNNIPVDDSGTSGMFYRIDLSSAPISAYVADFSGDNPDPFRATVILQDGKVIGENVQAGS